MARKTLWVLVFLLAGRVAAAQTDVASGRGLFQTRCADCHGIDAKGVHGPDLTVIFAAGATDDRVFQTIRRGVPGTEMPASNAPEGEIREVIAYLHSVSVRGSDADAAKSSNLANGERLFNASCTACHRVNGRGGVLGPDLSRVGAARSRSLLTEDIRDASAVIAPGYQPVTLVRSDGQQIRGARKNEDAYSIQIMDTREQLQGYRKSELREIVAEAKSLMPDFPQARLSDKDLHDLVGYLGTLRVGAGSVELSRPGIVSATGITPGDLLAGLNNSSRWLQYSGDYTGRRH